ncbi:hypothetical protein H4R33_005689 [Dimargaris cristalligena]|nr:hypothetical protein H4R33_005689 [Dimargaris cristalligena]
MSTDTPSGSLVTMNTSGDAFPPAANPQSTTTPRSRTARIEVTIDPRTCTFFSYPDLVRKQCPQILDPTSLQGKKSASHMGNGPTQPRGQGGDSDLGAAEDDGDGDDDDDEEEEEEEEAEDDVGGDSDASTSDPVTATAQPPKFGDDAFFENLLKRAEKYGDDKPQKRRREARVSLYEDYDLHDPFIDDSDIQGHVEDGTRLREDGFFVFYGPLEFVTEEEPSDPVAEELRPSKKRKMQKKKDEDNAPNITPTIKGKAKDKDKDKDKDKPADDTTASANGKSKKKPRTNGDSPPDEPSAKKPPKPKPAKSNDSTAEPTVSTATKKKPPSSEKAKKPVAPIKRKLSTDGVAEPTPAPVPAPIPATSAALMDSSSKSTPPATEGPSNFGTKPPHRTEQGYDSEPEPERKPLRPSIFNLIDHDDDGDDEANQYDFSPLKYHGTSNSCRGPAPPPSFPDRMSARPPFEALSTIHPFRSADNTPCKPPHTATESPLSAMRPLMRESPAPTPTPPTMHSYPSSPPIKPPPRTPPLDDSLLPTSTPSSVNSEALTQDFIAAAHRETFDNQKKFPTVLKTILTDLAMTTMIELGAHFSDVGHLVAAYQALNGSSDPGATAADKDKHKDKEKDKAQTPSSDTTEAAPNTSSSASKPKAGTTGSSLRNHELAFAVVTRDGKLRELLDANFYRRITECVPYNRATIRKVIARLTLQERIKIKETLAQTIFNQLKQLVEAAVAQLPPLPPPQPSAAASAIPALRTPGSTGSKPTSHPNTPPPPLPAFNSQSQASPSPSGPPPQGGKPPGNATTSIPIKPERDDGTFPSSLASSSALPLTTPLPQPPPVVVESAPPAPKRPGGLHYLLNHSDSEKDPSDDNIYASAVAPTASVDEVRPADRESPLDDTVTSKGVTRKFPWTEPIRQSLWTYVQNEIEIAILRSQLAEVEGKTLVVKETAIRRVAYQKVLPLWPEGWTTTIDISKEYGLKKRKLEKKMSAG